MNGCRWQMLLEKTVKFESVCYLSLAAEALLALLAVVWSVLLSE